MVQRTIRINHSQSSCNSIVNCNAIYTRKYTALNAIPKFLGEQFANYANLFFLLIAILQQFRAISPTNRYTTLIPLILVLMIGLAKEAFEETNRRRDDRRENRRKVQVFSSNSREEDSIKLGQIACQSINPGTIVVLEGAFSVPADLVVIYAGNSSPSSCSIWAHTQALDGETSLKEKLPALRSRCFSNQLPTEQELMQMLDEVKEVQVENPNSNLHSFTGKLILNSPNADGEEIPLRFKNLLLRASEVVKSGWLIGICVYCGEECKIAMNAADDSRNSKQTILVRGMNWIFVVLFLVIGAMSLFSALMSWWWKRKENVEFWKQILFASKRNSDETTTKLLVSLGEFGKNFLTFLILYNNFIPVSLVITCEVVRWQHAKFLEQDLAFWPKEPLVDGEEKEKEEFKSVCVNRSCILEDLGRISFIFSDKTGTLTTNQMHWKGGIIFEEGKSVVFDPFGMEENLEFGSLHSLLFIVGLFVCNSVVPSSELNENGKGFEVDYPEDDAIVEGFYALNWKLEEKNFNGKCRIINKHTNQTIECWIVKYVEFTSERKRVTALIRLEKEHWILSKGSDLTLGEFSDFCDVEISHKITQWSNQGMRTLALAAKKLSFIPKDGDYNLEEMEQNSAIIGAICLEDKIAQGVQKTIEALSESKIPIFIVTGDKLETSATIARSCGIIREDWNSVRISPEEIQKEKLSLSKSTNSLFTIDGNSFDLLLKDENSKDLVTFLSLLSDQRWKSGIFYRFSPGQKAKIVSLLKEHSQKAVLAIGDGSNDIGMIEAASVGVGIRGKEGSQAARASDISICQFSHLNRLLLVHGAWCYSRIFQVVLYSLYKNTLFYAIQFWFAFWNEFTGQTLFESWIIGLYNVLFSLLPPLLIGILDKHADEGLLEQNPPLYASLKGDSWRLSMKNFLVCLANSIVHSLIIFGFVFQMAQEDFIIGGGFKEGQIGGLWFVGCVVFVSVILTVVLKAALCVASWTKITFWGMLFNLIALFPLLLIYFHLGGTVLDVAKWEFYAISGPFFGCFSVWILFLLCPATCFLLDLCVKCCMNEWTPSDFQIAYEKSLSLGIGMRGAQEA